MTIFNPYHHLFRLLLILGSFSFTINAYQPSGNHEQKQRFLDTADSLAKIEKYEDALVYYFMAFEQGMSHDSLFYFWAELFLKRGDFDSALAVNRSALDINGIGLRKELLRQRYSIFVLLGADEQASKISEELYELNSVRKLSISPSLNTTLSLKFQTEEIKTPDSHYWTTYDSAGGYITNEVSAVLRLSGKLHLSNLPGKIPDFSLGPIFQIKKNSRIVALSESTPFDSLTFETGGYLSVETISKRVSIELRSTYSSDLYNMKRWINGLVYSYMADNSKVFSVGGYTLALQEGTHYDYQYGFLSMIFDASRNMEVSLSPSLTVSFFASKQDVIELSTFSSMLYFDVSAGESDKLPLFYRDSQVKNPLDTSGLNGSNKLFSLSSYQDQIKNGSTPVVAILELPLSYFRMEPAISTTISLKSKWTLKPSMKLGFDIYTGFYRWHDFINEEITPYMAVNYSDNSYYQITGIDDQGVVDIQGFGIGKKIGSYYSQRRFDTALQGAVSFGHKFKRAGNIIFSVQLNKSWTNLPSACPIEISKWSVLFNTDWYYSLPVSDSRIKK